MVVAIVDYGMGNLHSVHRKFVQLNVQAVVADSPGALKNADKIVLPGVGHFGKAMQNLRDRGMFDVLNEKVLVQRTPILGICLGMQLMARQSEEGEEKGFGWIDASVVRFNIGNKLQYKVPQTGWNTISISKSSRLMEGIEQGSEFYFLHSYHYHDTFAPSKLTTTHFEYEYVSAVEQENIFGTQFHPEKSHDTGLQLFKNFIQI